MDIAAVERVLAVECRLAKNQSVLLGLSGGPDSLSLLDVLIRSGYRVVAAHFDHKLRQESSREAASVRRIAEELGAACISGSGDVAALARENKWSIEEAARKARYQFLSKAARRTKAQAVAIAHTADDQVETVLMHILRGSGLAGLKGMGYRLDKNEWDAQIPIVRPFLSVWREEILEYCTERKLSPVFDQSNLDSTFFRNRLRLQLIPYLEQYNPKVKQGLWKMSRILETDATLLEEMVNQVWKDCLIMADSLSVTLNYAEVKRLPVGLLRRVLRKALSFLLQGEKDIEYEVIERGREFVAHPSGGRVELSGGVSLFLVGERLVVARKAEDLPLENWPQLQSDDVLVLEPPFHLDLKFGWVLEGRLLTSHPALNQMNDPCQSWLDADHLKFPLTIRSMQPGERFQPLGMEGRTVKLSDFWINKKISRFVRKNWPLVLSNEQIAWVPGGRPAHFCRLRAQTERILYLDLIRPETENPGV